MASYSYSAINAQGAELTGEVVAPDLAGAREQLRLKGLLAESLREISGSGEGKASVLKTSFGAKVKPKSLQVFSRQFATMIEAGLNVVGSLVILEQQTDDPALAVVVKHLRQDVEGGLLLSEALVKHPRVFSRLYVAMVEAGEAAGILDIVLDRVAFQIEKQESIRRRIKSAMVYPTMVICFATLVLIGMLLFLVPIFQGIFASLNGQLPQLTQYVVDASNLLKGAPWVLLFIPLGLWSFFRWKRTEIGRKNWDRFKLRIPMKIGDTVRKVTMARFSRPPEGARGCADRAAVDREPRVPADGQPDGEDRRGDGRAREDAYEDRRLLRGGGRRSGVVAHLDHRAAHDDRRRDHGRHHPHRHVPADVQDAPPRQQQRRLLAGAHWLRPAFARKLAP
jgi:type IV pilus assembly protein PilC